MMTLPSSQIFPSPQSCNARRVFIPLQDLYLYNELNTMKAVLMISVSLWACSHLLQDPIEMQVTWHCMATTTPITTDSEVSLGDRMWCRQPREGIVPVHSQALQVPLSLGYQTPLFCNLCILNQIFFLQLALYLR